MTDNDEIYLALFQETISIAEEDESILGDLERFIECIESLLPSDVIKFVSAMLSYKFFHMFYKSQFL